MHQKLLPLFVVLMASLFFAQPARATDAPESLAVQRTQTPPSLHENAGWETAPAIALGWDYTNGKPASEPTRVQFLADGKMLYVRFDVTQREPVVATQRVNDVGDGSDDEVSVYLWPSGAGGFRYQFSATPKGTHYQYSTENANYAPTWTSYGMVTPGGYRVVMAIPLSSLRSDGREVWLAQFTRYVQRGGKTDEWTHRSGQSGTASSVFAGHLTGMNFTAAAARTQPRVGLYTLGQDASQSFGGSTSRVGADISVPVTATASFVAAIHPDFSNVEVDQQTISPTAFQRRFNEVRPFFSQSASNIYGGNCDGCPNLNELYTPNIPTPRDGYAFEGTQGPFTFGSFDAVGTARNDAAQTLSYNTPSRHLFVSETDIDANLPGIHDNTTVLQASYDTLTHYNAYFDYGNDTGTNVLAGSRAQRYDGGFAYYSKDDFDSFTLRKIGQFYNPVDGLFSLTDITGYSGQLNHTFQYGPKRRFQSLSVGAFLDHYQGTTGGTDLADGNVYVMLTARTKFDVSATTGYSYVRLPSDILRPENQNGIGLQYQANTALQSQFVYNTGVFGSGRLVTINRDVAFKVAHVATVALNDDDTNWLGTSNVRDIQWLERAAVSFDLGPRSSFSIGLRKTIGNPPPFATLTPFQYGTNVSVGFSKRLPHDEIFLVYGDASQFTTTPALTFKYVHYFGAEKGT
jgi:hypothetical protein